MESATKAGQPDLLTLTFKLLGKPEVWLGEHRLTEFNTAKTEALLYYLVVTGQPHTRDHLATLLWGEMPDDKAKRNLTKSVQVLRKLLGPYLHIETQSIAFNLAALHESDVTAFAQSNPEPDDLASLESRIARYRGDFLDGLQPNDAPEFEAWLVRKREYLRETLLQLLDKIIDACSDAHSVEANAPRGIEYANRLLALDPWRESAHRQIMTLLATVGQRSAALAQYEQCRNVLADELGIEPSLETTTLYERLKTASRIVPNNLAIIATRFVGREDELQRIDAQLQQPECRLLTLMGPGGIGKTRLALQAALQFIQSDMSDSTTHPPTALRFGDGVYFVNLAAVQATDADADAAGNAIMFAVAETLHLFRKTTDDVPTRLHDYLHDKRLLLVLDNFEQLIAGAAMLTTLLQLSPQLKLLVTSRERLNLREEWTIEVPGLSDKHAHTLFEQLAHQVRGAALPTSDLSHVLKICLVTQNTPLALELAARWLRVLSCADVAQEIEASLDFLTTNLRDLPERHRSLRAVFDHSWRLLSDQERDAFQRLTALRAGFTREAAQAVAGASLGLLAALADKSLIRLKLDGRYELHELLRQFGAQQLAGNVALENATRERHCAYFFGWLKRQELRLRNPDFQERALEEVETEQDDLRAAWTWAVQHQLTNRITEGLECVGTFIDLRGGFAEGRDVLGLTIDAMAGLEPEEARCLLMRLLCWQTNFFFELGDVPSAQQTLTRAQTTLEHPSLAQCDTRLEQGMLLFWRAKLVVHADRASAQQLMEKSRALFLAMGDTWWHTRAGE